MRKTLCHTLLLYHIKLIIVLIVKESDIVMGKFEKIFILIAI